LVLGFGRWLFRFVFFFFFKSKNRFI